MSTIRDVAKLAGVSPAVVSRVINGHENVRAPTRISVENAIKSLGYEAKPRGRQLGFRPTSSKKEERILVLTQGPNEIEMNDSAYNVLFQHLQLECQKNGLNISLMDKALYDSKATVGIHGVIFAGDAVQVDRIDAPSLRVMGSIKNRDPLDRVSYDNHILGELAAEAFAEHKCKKVAVISKGGALFDERRDAFLSRAKELGMKVMPLHSDLQSSYKAYSDPQDHPDGIFVVVDDYLPPLYAVLSMQNLVPMKDILIIGCNAQRSILHQCQPTPWSFDLQLSTLAKLCLQQLHLRKSNPSTSPIHISLTPVLKK